MPLVEQEVVSGQRRARQEPDPMARMAEMLKNLQQEIRLLKEGRTQEIRDNVPFVVNQDRAQPEGGSAVRGGGNSWEFPSNFLGIPYSHLNSSANHIPKNMNPRSSILLMEEMGVLWNM